MYSCEINTFFIIQLKFMYIVYRSMLGYFKTKKRCDFYR